MMKAAEHFNNWIAKNFRGLSAKTLVDYLLMDGIYTHEEADNIVYVTLYSIFIHKPIFGAIKVFEGLKIDLEYCDWL